FRVFFIQTFYLASILMFLPEPLYSLQCKVCSDSSVSRHGFTLQFSFYRIFCNFYGNYVLTFTDMYTKIYEHVYRGARVCSCNVLFIIFGNGGVLHWLKSNLIRKEF